MADDKMVDLLPTKAKAILAAGVGLLGLIGGGGFVHLKSELATVKALISGAAPSPASANTLCNCPCGCNPLAKPVNK